jgi:folate-dependent phosphoribosylglycinamide formyltransferase PurN
MGTTEKLTSLERPIRVVHFGIGPVLEYGVKKFLCRLEKHPDIELVGSFCQSDEQTFGAVFRDLWQRRRFLAIPLLLLEGFNLIARYLSHPRAEIELKRKIDQLSVRIHFVPDIHADEVLDRVRSLNPDLGLSYSSPILKPVIFEIPACGTLGIHHGKVPEYRGKKTMFWAMFNGEETAGVTIQKINPGLDTGEIVKEGEVSAGCRTQRAVWNELEALGLDLFIKAIIEVKEDTAVYRPQVGKKGKLYTDPKIGEILAFWLKQYKKRLVRC